MSAFERKIRHLPRENFYPGLLLLVIVAQCQPVKASRQVTHHQILIIVRVVIDRSTTAIGLDDHIDMMTAIGEAGQCDRLAAFGDGRGAIGCCANTDVRITLDRTPRGRMGTERAFEYFQVPRRGRSSQNTLF